MTDESQLMSKIKATLVFFACGMMFLHASNASEDTVELSPRVGETIKIRLTATDRPVASVILFASHKKDGCRVTPASGAKKIKSKLKNAPVVEI
ncbi:MAG: hypothetical protein AMS22_14370, partial [Thiotrichales bacterium SG8_50]